jgi:hypothetical protein
MTVTPPKDTPEVSEPQTFTLTLRPLSHGWRTSPIQRLRIALKVLLRGFGMRCVDIKTEPPMKEAGK